MKRLLAGLLALCLLLGGCSVEQRHPLSKIEEEQLLQNAEWLTIQLGWALNYSSDTPSLSTDSHISFLQTERFVFSGKDYLTEEGYLYPNSFYETND